MCICIVVGTNWWLAELSVICLHGVLSLFAIQKMAIWRSNLACMQIRHACGVPFCIAYEVMLMHAVC